MAMRNLPVLSFYKTILLLSRIISLLKGANPVKIVSLDVPRWVPNGTNHVILDCEYRYTENDLRLVVKWFFNDDSEPVYQWIPQLEKRHVAEFLHGRLNLSYTANSGDRYSRYRALYILNPSIEMSGKYTCHVASLAGQDSRHQEMLVFIPATTFNFNFTKCSDSEVSFLCNARGLYPRPRISLSIQPLDNKEQKTYKKIHSRVNKSGATYDASITGKLFTAGLAGHQPPLLECKVEIPGTHYKISKQISYFPSLHDTNKALKK
ncbi:uncharacterized protein LOC111086130 isoform X2 [Limulus polyphemus]|uniref:Uncharacterized protein LOC111086130 isoform X2 n=1 Tax=Limulus polyphemus TaxID=6850 RepID=A0ABM1SIK9_LIMPO|nr:uncharacterized protein LOC111086130 isoform X2 [Limulus polyphemus]